MSVRISGKTPSIRMVKIVILGDYNVGKTSTLHRVAGHTRHRKTSVAGPHVQMQMPMSVTTTMPVRGNDVIVKILDTGGQERYRSLTASYYRGAHGCLIVYDVTKLSSFENINYWLSDLKEYTSQPEISAILVGTKCHVPEEDREVTSERAQKFAESVGLPYMEVSAEESINVTEVFEKLADLIIQNLTKHPTVITNVIKPHTETLQQQKAKKKWCSC